MKKLFGINGFFKKPKKSEMTHLQEVRSFYNAQMNDNNMQAQGKN